jgi:hypothetical protein
VDWEAEMKVSELIEVLQKVKRQDAEVCIWLDGDRFTLDPGIPVDDQLFDFDNIIDLNLKGETE